MARHALDSMNFGSPIIHFDDGAACVMLVDARNGGFVWRDEFEVRSPARHRYDEMDENNGVVWTVDGFEAPRKWTADSHTAVEFEYLLP